MGRESSMRTTEDRSRGYEIPAQREVRESGRVDRDAGVERGGGLGAGSAALSASRRISLALRPGPIPSYGPLPRSIPQVEDPHPSSLKQSRVGTSTLGRSFGGTGLGSTYRDKGVASPSTGAAPASLSGARTGTTAALVRGVEAAGGGRRRRSGRGRHARRVRASAGDALTRNAGAEVGVGPVRGSPRGGERAESRGP